MSGNSDASPAPASEATVAGWSAADRGDDAGTTHPTARLLEGAPIAREIRAEVAHSVQAFVAAHDDFSIVPVPTLWAEAVGGTCPSPGPFLRLTPATTETDGFFVATLTRGRASQPKPESAA